MNHVKTRDMVRGLIVVNPDDIEEKYLNKTIDYAIARGYDHFQFTGPIHNPVRGNIDGMTVSRKYAQFNGEKDMDYVEMNLRVVNAALDRLHAAGIKSYMWHHELDMPSAFSSAYPEVLNADGDVEVSHPLVRDYLENKIIDFFAEYPKMDGIILTLHETKIPLLKLKNQKLDKIGRVKYVTEILFQTCEKLGKELVCRPFASIPEDYDMMLKAYESISKNLIVMDKWTQFDWSLTLPHNAFFQKVKNNPLLVETDIFGEYFGKGHLPILLKDHIVDKFKYCEQFSPVGYANRVDRERHHPFGSVNEVNLEIMYACMSGKDVDEAIDEFFAREYPNVAEEVKAIMMPTEELNRKLLQNKNYYFMQGSFFPELNHSKNHFFFEMMKEDYDIASDEWFIPKKWVRGTIESLFEEKDWLVAQATDLFRRVQALEGKVTKDQYKNLYQLFANLYYSANIWRQFMSVLYDYVKYFESGNAEYEKAFYAALDKMLAWDNEGKAAVGNTHDYFLNHFGFVENQGKMTAVESIIPELKESFAAEKACYFDMLAEGNVDVVNCGGAMESHRLKKEVNFSDTLLINGKSCRIPGNRRGAQWSQINAHGWFSYEVKVLPNQKNEFVVEMDSLTEQLDVKITIGEEQFTVREKAPKVDGQAFSFIYDEKKGEDKVRIRFDRISAYTPLVYSIRVK